MDTNTYAVVYLTEPEGKRKYEFVKTESMHKVLEVAIRLLPKVWEIISVIKVK